MAVCVEWGMYKKIHAENIRIISPFHGLLFEIRVKIFNFARIITEITAL